MKTYLENLENDNKLLHEKLDFLRSKENVGEKDLGFIRSFNNDLVRKEIESLVRQIDDALVDIGEEMRDFPSEIEKLMQDSSLLEKEKKNLKVILSFLS